MAGVYDFTATSLAGEDIPLKRFEGQVLLIVNTASACGFTPQYRGLEALHQALGPRGFSVLGFPCNQFGSQEPGDAAQIEQFCASNYAITLPERSTRNLVKFHLIDEPSTPDFSLFRYWYSGCTRKPLTSILANIGKLMA